MAMIVEAVEDQMAMIVQAGEKQMYTLEVVNAIHCSHV
jgi:hypothetical protein